MAIYRGNGGASDATDQATNQAALAQQYAANAAISASSAATTLTDFNNVYLGVKSAAPTVDNSGTPLNEGDLYYNSVFGRLQVYTNIGWADTAVATASSFVLDTFSGTGIQTNFTLSIIPAEIQSVLVFVSGIKLRPTTDYTFSGTTLTFIVAPTSGTNNISVTTIRAMATGVPDDNSISTVKIQNSAVTDDKLSTGLNANKLTGGMVGQVLTSGGIGVAASWVTPLATAITNTPTGNIAAVTVQAAINELDTEKANLTALAASTGSSLIGWISTVASTVSTTLDKWMAWRSISVFEFMTDAQRADVQARTLTLDVTTPLNTAISYCKTNRKKLWLNDGSYLISDTLDCGSVSNNQQLRIEGAGFGATIIKKSALNTNPMMRIGSSSATSFTSNVDIDNFTLEGNSTATTSAGLELWDVVQSNIKVRTRLCGDGVKSNGGISIDFNESDFSANNYGIRAIKFTSLAGGGYPNNINIKNSNIKSNATWGAYFDDGRVFNINFTDIESNGTNGNSATGGVYIGSGVGDENGFLSSGLTMNNCWMEANAGDAAIQLNDGINYIEKTYFIANTNATNDIHIKGGEYHIEKSDFDSNKVANILEDAAVLTGNSIKYSTTTGGTTYDAAKTMFVNYKNIFMRSGQVPVVMSVNKPTQQQGFATVSAVGVATITYPTAYSIAPVITGVTVTDASPGRVYSAQISSVGTSSFVVQLTYVLTGSSTVVLANGIGFYWTAVGTVA